jgi:hypothetical protein
VSSGIPSAVWRHLISPLGARFSNLPAPDPIKFAGSVVSPTALRADCSSAARGTIQSHASVMPRKCQPELKTTWVGE